MRVSEINIYPIKSLGGVELNDSIIEPRGLALDRRWMLVDQDGSFLTQRAFPQMATLGVSIGSDGLHVTANGESIAVPFETSSYNEIDVSVWQSRCSAQVYDDSINRWFSQALQTNCQLVFMPEETRRLVNPVYAVRQDEDVVSFADGYPILLIGQNSLSDLNGKLEKPVSMNRFRPNLVVAGCDAFAEDTWKQIKIGQSVFHIVKPCERCVITTIDQATGEFDGKDPLKTLASYRLVKKESEQKILFGQNLIAGGFGGTIRVGDQIEVIETK